MVTELSVILISKNQEWNITRLIESVMQGTASLSSIEIVLVDSGSTDETIQTASHYPVRILVLQSDQYLTPAAGRYVGYKYSRGKLVLFLDGDMELCQGWLEKALQVIQDRSDVAVVTGHVVEVPETGGACDKPPWRKSEIDGGVEVSFAGGAALYRRSVLQQVGIFNPYLYSDEEPELCIRVRHAGYKVVRLEYPLVYHYSNPIGTLSTLVRRWRRNLYLGAGQNIRYHLGDEFLWAYLKERGYALIPGLTLGVGLISFFWSWITHQWQWFSLWLLLLGVTIGGDAYRKQSLYRTIISLTERMFIVEGTIRGFLLKPLDPKGYLSQSTVTELARKHPSETPHREAHYHLP